MLKMSSDTMVYVLAIVVSAGSNFHFNSWAACGLTAIRVYKPGPPNR